MPRCLATPILKDVIIGSDLAKGTGYWTYQAVQRTKIDTDDGHGDIGESMVGEYAGGITSR